MTRLALAAVALAIVSTVPFGTPARAADDAAILRLSSEYGDAYARVCRVKVTRIHREGRTIVRRVRSCSDAGDVARVHGVIRTEGRGGDNVRIRRDTIRTGGEVRV